jgi:hypothetical protein
MIRAEPGDRLGACDAESVRCATGTVLLLAEDEPEARPDPVPPLAAEHPASTTASTTSAAGQRGVDFLILIPFDQGNANA